MPFAIVYMHVETMKKGMGLGLYRRSILFSNDIAVIDGCHGN